MIVTVRLSFKSLVVPEAWREICTVGSNVTRGKIADQPRVQGHLALHQRELLTQWTPSFQGIRCGFAVRRLLDAGYQGRYIPSGIYASRAFSRRFAACPLHPSAAGREADASLRARGHHARSASGRVHPTQLWVALSHGRRAGAKRVDHPGGAGEGRQSSRADELPPDTDGARGAR